MIAFRTGSSATLWTATALLSLAVATLSGLACAPQRSDDAQGGGEKTVSDPATKASARQAVRLAIGGFLDGHLEPCGCAKAQLGGLARRVFYLQRARDQHDLVLEGGNLVHDASPLSMMKLVTALEVFRFAPPKAIAIGPKDLELAFDELKSYLLGFGHTFISSDLAAREGVEWPVQPFVEHAVEGRGRIRVTALTLARPDAVADRLDLLEPAAAWRRALDGAAPDTLRVVFVHGSRDRIRELSDSLQPAPDLVIGVSAEVPEPPSSPDNSPKRDIPVVWTGTRGRSLSRVWLRRSGDAPLISKYDVMALRGSETVKGAMESRDAKAAIVQHRHTVAAMELREAMANQRAPVIEGATYVGSVACSGCHAKAWTAWQGTKHAGAWKTLETAEKDASRYGWPVTKYPDCIGCHTVGYGERSGFVNPKTTPLLVNVGCEECHGPGSAHIAAPAGRKKESILRGGAEKCLECHNQEQSPDFDYLKRWLKIQHK